MRILVTGANGFIGSYITAELLKNNYEVTCCVRDVESTKKKFPTAEVIYCDFNIDLTPQSWINRLNNIDIVINVSGVLTSSMLIILKMFMSMVQKLYLRLAPLLT
ncbi:NAD-dependent epimerase/dehydratase family protein [Candidatus Rickettsia colombianensi]|nr:NAD-dependent epimerase/dehydratase family protein [Candidatus Rickettsia colombianensi]